MNSKLKLIFIIGAVAMGMLFYVDVMAAIQQPSFVTGDGERAIEQASGRAFTVIAGIAAAIAAITASVGGIMIMAGKADEGKQWVVRSVIGLVVISSVSLIYYIVG